MDHDESGVNQKITQLKEARESLGWSQERCAHALGVTFSSLSRWERGESVPRSEAILRAIDEWITQHTDSAAGDTQAK